MGFKPLNDPTIKSSRFRPIQEPEPEAPPKSVTHNLPQTLKFGPWDTGVEMPDNVSAALVGMGSGMTDTYRGVKQILGIDEEEMAQDAAYMRDLKADPEVGNYATGGEFAGFIADPVALAVPLAKGKTLAQMAGIGAGAGAAFGGAGYVDEEAGQTRMENAMWGAAGGGALMPAIGAGANVVRKARGKETIPLFKRHNADLAVKSGVVPSPEEAPKAIKLLENKPDEMIVFPDGTVGTKSQLDEMVSKMKPEERVDFMANQYNKKLEASFPPKPQINQSPVDIKEKPFKLTDESLKEKQVDLAFDVKEGKTPDGPMQAGFQKAYSKELNKSGTLYSNPLDPALIKDTFKKSAEFYQKYGGSPLKNLVFNNAGASTTGALGAVVGYNTAEEDASTLEKFGRAGLGFALGYGGAKGFSKIPTKDGKMGDVLGRGLIDNYGLSSDYVRLKKEYGANKNHIAQQFVELARDAAQLNPGERKLLYNILQGEAPSADNLKGLTEKTRNKITEYGQKMVDYGLLDEEVFNKNAATYLHRSYSSKLGNKPGVIGRKIKMVGNELKPRGIVKTVSKKNLKKWTDQGWEVFGKESKGKKQQIRWHLTKEQRQQLGEIEDAAFAVAETGRLMSNDIATFKLFDDLSAKIAKEENPGNWIKIQDGKIPKTSINKFGNLEGKYVPEEIYNDLKWINRTKNVKNMPGIRHYRALNAWWKVSKTALNPVVHTNNVMSNLMLLDFSGTEYKYLSDSALDLYRASKGQQSDIYKKAIQMGIFDADFATNELRALNKDWLKEYASLKDVSSDPLSKSVELSKNLWRKTGGRMINLYQKEDHLFRLAVFKDRLAKGVDPHTAAQEARRWFIDYDINAPLINMMRETATPFLAYSYRVLPLLAESAIMRPWKYAKWAAIGYGMNTLGEELGGGDTEKERSLMPEKQKGHIFGMPFMQPQMIKSPVRFDDKSQYLDVTRWVPGGDVLELGQDKAGIPLLPTPLQPSFGALGSLQSTVFNYDPFTQKKLRGLDVGATPLERTMNNIKVKAKYLAQQFAPNFPGVPGSYSTKKIKGAFQGVETPLGDRLPVWQAVIQTFGIKLRPADLQKMEQREMFQTKQHIENVGQEIMRLTFDYNSMKISEEEYDTQLLEHENTIRKLTEGLHNKLNPKQAR